MCVSPPNQQDTLMTDTIEIIQLRRKMFVEKEAEFFFSKKLTSLFVFVMATILENYIKL